MDDTTAEVIPGEAGNDGSGAVDLGQGFSQPVATGNPNWQPFLDVLPSSLHTTVTPVLQQWDQGVQQRFQEINEQYAPYEAYKPFIENQVDPQAMEYAMGIFQQLNENPRAIYDALQQAYSEEWGLNQQSQGDPNGYDQTPSYGEEGYNDPRVSQLEEGFKQLASVIISEREQQSQVIQFQQEDQQLDTILTGLRGQHGDFNEQIVLGLMLSGMDPVSAVTQYKSDIQAQVEAARRPAAPGIISQGGVAAPAQQNEVRKLDGKNTRAMVAQILEQAHNSA